MASNGRRTEAHGPCRTHSTPATDHRLARRQPSGNSGSINVRLLSCFKNARVLSGGGGGGGEERDTGGGALMLMPACL